MSEARRHLKSVITEQANRMALGSWSTMHDRIKAFERALSEIANFAHEKDAAICGEYLEDAACHEAQVRILSDKQ